MTHNVKINYDTLRFKDIADSLLKYKAIKNNTPLIPDINEIITSYLRVDFKCTRCCIAFTSRHKMHMIGRQKEEGTYLSDADIILCVDCNKRLSRHVLVLHQMRRRNETAKRVIEMNWKCLQIDERDKFLEPL